MKTLLIYPPYTSHIVDPIKANPPLGLAYIAAYLEKHNFEVKILDALALGINNITKKGDFISAGLDDKDIKSYVRKYDPDVVGIFGGITSNIHNSHNCARIVKEANPNAQVIFGGAHSTACPEIVLKDKNVDMIVKGEGETTFLEIVRKLEKDKSLTNLTNIEGTIIKKNGKIKINTDRPFIKDLDSLPFPARHLLPMKIYAKVSPLAKDHYMRHPRANMVSSRGCPGNCVFCSIHSIWGHKWRARSAENVLDEMSLLVEKYGIHEIAFYDDNVSVDKKRLIDICNGIRKMGLDIKWDTPNGVPIWSLDKEVIQNMAKSGCYRLMFGIESACPQTQGYIRKTIKLDFCNRIIKYANNAGLWTQSTFILGFPNEKIESINQTLNFIVKSDLDFVRIYIATPFPGTNMYNDFVKEGLIEDYKVIGNLNKYASVSFGGINTKYFTAEKLRELQSMMYSRFIKSRVPKFLNPLRLLKKINSLEDLKYALKVGKIVLEAKFHPKENLTNLLQQRKECIFSN